MLLFLNFGEKMVVKNHLNQKEMMQFVVHQVAEIIIIKNKIEVNYLQKNNKK